MSETSASPSVPQWRIDTWFPDLGADVIGKLRVYHDELQKFNRTLNLVSPKTLVFADLIHFADSILASQIIMKDNPKLSAISDLGSGNGFPGLVMALLYPNVQIQLVDSDQRKCEFLKHTASSLSLGNVKVLNSTIEALPANAIQVCMCRGFASISKAILVTRKSVPKGGVFYHMKGENWSAEVGQIPTQLCSVWAPALVGEYKLPLGSFKFAVVRTDKISG